MIQIPVGPMVALVDDDDAPLVAKRSWCINSDGSAITGGSISMHRLIMQPADGCDVSHRDGNRLNNQRANLLVVPRSANAHRARIRRDNTSGYKGVSYDRQRADLNKAPWRAQVMAKGKRHVSTWCWTPEEAAQWYNSTARDLFGERAYQNDLPRTATR